jgi:signal transduction histidine kinase
MAPTVPEPAPVHPATHPATARPDGPGSEWPSPLRQVQAAFRGHPYRQDGLLTFGLLLLSVTAQVSQPPATWSVTPLLVISTLVQCLSLIWRLRAPFPVYCVVLVSCTVQWSMGQGSASNVALMSCLYTLARYWSLNDLPWAVGAAVPSMFLLSFRVKQQDQVRDLGTEVVSLFFLATAVAASIALGLVARERQAQLKALADRAAHAEFEREQRARIAVLAERARFSREMHDIVGHTLAVITGLADGGVRQVEAKPERGRQALELIGDTSRHALADLRRTLGALSERPLYDGAEVLGAGTLTPQPGVADIAELLERTRSAGPRVSYHASGLLDGLPPSLQLAIFRIVQESLTNSLKHAGPDTNVQVVFEVGEESLRLSVSDTGSEHRGAPPSWGLFGQGLTGVRERAALAGGSAAAGPNKAGGWTVTAELPLNHPEEP